MEAWRWIRLSKSLPNKKIALKKKKNGCVFGPGIDLHHHCDSLSKGGHRGKGASCTCAASRNFA
jgi:hypothetical protein